MARRPAPPIAADPVTAYACAVVAGTEPAGPHVRDACARHLDDLARGPGRGMAWDVAAANRIVSYFRDVLTVDVGGETRPFALLPWQAFVVGSLFGWKIAATGYRRFRVAYVEAGKGSGKSPMAAGIGLYMLTADGEPKAEVYAAASKKSQAMVLFRDAVNMWKNNPLLNTKLRPDGGEGKEYRLYNPKSRGWFEVIASDTGKGGAGQSGPRPHCGLLDEIHEHADDSVVRLMRAGTKGRTQALMFMITNSGSSRGGVCWDFHGYAGKVCARTLEDDSFFAYVCALDDGDNPMDDESCWPKANPSLGHTFQASYLRELVVSARGMPSAEASVRRLNFCEWTDAAAPWIDRDLFDSCERDFNTDDMKGRPCWLGLDLSAKRDLTAASAVWADLDGESYDLASWFWTPGDTAAERAKVDSVDYPLWIKQGFMFGEPGRIIDLGRVAAWVQQFCAVHDVQALAFDQALIDDFMSACDRIGFDVWIDERTVDADGRPKGAPGAGLRMVRHGQGFAGYAHATTLWMPRSIGHLESLIIKGAIRIQRNPVYRWCSASAVLLTDESNNRKWDKRKSTGRIDGMISSTEAVGAAMAPAPPPPEPSIWGRPELWN